MSSTGPSVKSSVQPRSTSRAPTLPLRRIRTPIHCQWRVDTCKLFHPGLGKCQHMSSTGPSVKSSVQPRSTSHPSTLPLRRIQTPIPGQWRADTCKLFHPGLGKCQHMSSTGPSVKPSVQPWSTSHPSTLPLRRNQTPIHCQWRVDTCKLLHPGLGKCQHTCSVGPPVRVMLSMEPSST